MKKRMVSLLCVFALLSSMCGVLAADQITPRWTFLNHITTSIDMTPDGTGIDWFATAECYELSQLTHTAITITLQEANSYGWFEIDSDTVKTAGAWAGAGGYYYDWQPGKSYRIKTEVWAYQNNVKLEYGGPFYQYLNT